MSFIKLCNDDPILDLLRKTFHANPISVPEERIQPLVILSRKNRKNSYIGPLEHLLIDGKPLKLDIKNSQMPDLSAKQTKSINTEIGLQILDGFLHGLGTNSACISFAFKDSSTVSFSFKNVVRHYIEPSGLTQILSKRKLNPQNAFIRSFINEESRCILMDSVIVSNSFTIKKEVLNGNTIAFDLPEINELISSKKNKIQVSTSSELELTFEGTKQLAFAYTGFYLEVDTDGSVYYKEPDMSYLAKNPSDLDEASNTPEIFVEDDFGLSEIEFE